jgi:hypothetical protein
MLRHPAAGELRMCSFWAGSISSFPFSRAREYRLLRRLVFINFFEITGVPILEAVRRQNYQQFIQ